MPRKSNSTEGWFMSDLHEEVGELLGRIERSLAVLDHQESEYAAYLRDDLPVLGEKTTSAMILAEFMTDYYTCLETLFLRISQYFENNLSAERWHRDLLEKMTLNIVGVRQAVIREDTHSILIELMKFRHFRRYCFEWDNDWAKLKYLKVKFERLNGLVRRDLKDFVCFLERLGKAG